MKKILLINGNSKDECFCQALTSAYSDGAAQEGFEIETVHLSKLKFDAVFRSGYESAQALEPDLIELQRKISEADHLVFVYPIWWGTVPALLKGALDRTFLPGFAFKYQKGSPFPKKLLSGKTARLIVTMDTPPWYYKLVYGAPGHKMMKRTVLEFCGIQPVKITEFGPILHSSDKQRQKWLEQTRKLGKEAA